MQFETKTAVDRFDSVPPMTGAQSLDGMMALPVTALTLEAVDGASLTGADAKSTWCNQLHQNIFMNGVLGLLEVADRLHVLHALTP